LENVDVSNIYQVSIRFAPFIDQLWKALLLPGKPVATDRWRVWQNLSLEFDKGYPTVSVGVVGKYSGLKDSYLSLTHAIQHAAVRLQRRANVVFNESTELESPSAPSTAPAWQQLRNCEALVIPGGFGQRGIEGMISASNYGRINKIPTLGICLGMQVMVIEWSRNVLQLRQANSHEFSDSTPHPLLIIMEGKDGQMGGTMRLGRQPVHLLADSRVSALYEQQTTVHERHRHRYEVNPKYHSYFGDDSQLRFSGFDQSGRRVETIEHQGEQFYVGCQFHPEFQTYPDRPHPLFIGLLS
jgi:CTP synthase